MNTRQLARRHFLQAAGAGLALPLLDCMQPAFARAAESAAPKRLLAIHVPLGMMPQFFFPKKLENADGKTDATVPTSPYLDLLAAHRGYFTSFSGVSHPGVDGNHHAGQCFLSGAPHPGQPTFRNSVSLDQFAAERLGIGTRFPSLAFSVRKAENYNDSVASRVRESAFPRKRVPNGSIESCSSQVLPMKRPRRCSVSKPAVACSI